jgi:hypothetical protein
MRTLLTTQILLLVLAASCCGVQQAGAGANCEASDVAKLAAAISPALTAALNEPKDAAAIALESLAPVGMDAVVCGVEAIVSGMEGGKSMAVPAIAQVQVLTSGRAYLVAKGRRKAP